MRLDNGVGDAGGELFAIGLGLRSAVFVGVASGGGMGVGRGNQHVVSRDPGFFGGDLLGFVEHLAFDQAIVHHCDGDCRLPITEHGAARVQRVVRLVGGA